MIRVLKSFSMTRLTQNIVDPVIIKKKPPRLLYCQNPIAAITIAKGSLGLIILIVGLIVVGLVPIVKLLVLDIKCLVTIIITRLVQEERVKRPAPKNNVLAAHWTPYFFLFHITLTKPTLDARFMKQVSTT
jgi:hypothetical protein